MQFGWRVAGEACNARRETAEEDRGQTNHYKEIGPRRVRRELSGNGPQPEDPRPYWVLFSPCRTWVTRYTGLPIFWERRNELALTPVVVGSAGPGEGGRVLRAGHALEHRVAMLNEGELAGPLHALSIKAFAPGEPS